MEVTSTLSKTFKRFTIPRSTSSMGSFSTLNGTATSVELKYEDSTPSSQTTDIPPSNGHSCSHHKHPPLSYVQHIRPIQHLSQQNLSSPSQKSEQQQQQQSQLKYHLPTRPLSGDIPSFMIRSASTNFHPSNEIKINVSNNKNSASLYKSSIQRDMSYDNIKSLTMDEPLKLKSETRSSIKSLLSKTFHPLSTTTTSNEKATTIDQTKSEVKQKKRRTSFRHFSQFLKRSHSTNTNLSTIVATTSTSNNHDQQQKSQLTADLIYQRLHAKPHEETDSSCITRSNTSIMCNSSGTALVPISEEENPMPTKLSNRLQTKQIDDDDYYYDNTTRSDSGGALTHQQTQRIAPSLSLSSSSSFISAHTSSPSGISSTSNKTRNTTMNSNQYQTREDPIHKPSKSPSSVTSNIGTALAVLAKNNQDKHFLSNSISLHGDVSTFINTQLNNHHSSTSAINNVNASSATNNNKGRTVVHQTVSLTLDDSTKQISAREVPIETENSNQSMTKVKMRDLSSKKKKSLRDLTSRISLPPELKNGFSLHKQHSSINNNNNNNHHQSSGLNLTNKLKLSHQQLQQKQQQQLQQRSSYYQTSSLSTQTLNHVLHQSNSSLLRLSPSQLNTSIGGQLSRNEQRLSMLDLGFGKIESYIKLEKLGEGTYATVYKGKSHLLNGYIALKEIRLEQEEGAPCTALREVSLLKGLKHNNIVSLHDIIFNQTTLTLVFEYVEKDLKQYMDDCGNILHIKNVRLFLFQLLRGLDFCHSKKILHRDLKPQNLLINERGELKLADFGLARIKSFPTKTYSHEVVTLWYRPPDVLLGSTEYSTPIDIWAVGCIFYEMACGRPLFAGTKVDEELYLIFKCLGTPTEQTLPGVTTNTDFQALRLPYYHGESLNHLAPRLDSIGIDLLENFLRYNPLSRISAHDAMRHRFFSCYPAAIHTLGSLQSVVDLNEITLTKDHGSKLITASLMKTAISKRSSVHL